MFNCSLTFLLQDGEKRYIVFCHLRVAKCNFEFSKNTIRQRIGNIHVGKDIFLDI